jgi:hypothetical protein
MATLNFVFFFMQGRSEFDSIKIASFIILNIPIHLTSLSCLNKKWKNQVIDLGFTQELRTLRKEENTLYNLKLYNVVCIT